MALGIVFFELLGMIIFNYLLFNGMRLIDIVKKKKTILIWSIVYTLIVLIFSKNSSVALIIIFFIHTYIISRKTKNNFGIALIQVVISLAILGLAEVTFIIGINFIFRAYNISEKAYFFINIFAITITIILIDQLVRARVLNLSDFVSKHRNSCIIAINILIFFLFYKNVIQIESISARQIINIGFLTVVLIIVNILYFLMSIKKEKLTKKVEIKESINPLLEELIDKMRCSEHEYKNHLNILYCMMQVCEEDELKDRAKKYIGEAIANANLLSKVSDIENIIIKAILLSKIKKAEENEIDLEYVIDSTLESLPLDDSELTVVLSNLLNNAIEAASSSEDKFIEVFVGENNEKHIIKVANSTKNFSKDKIEKIMKPRYSTKGEGRGYGLYNIKNVVEKYKGNMDISFEDNIIEVLVEI